MFVLGVDVGKSELYARLLQIPEPGKAIPLGTVRSVPNTVKGHEQLLAWLKKFTSGEEVSVVMESTSVYWERVAITLHELGCRVSVVNPAQIKFFAKSTLRRGKTDKLDAELIARYGAVMHPARWMPPEADLVELHALLHARDNIVELQVVEAGRHHAMDHQYQPSSKALGFCEARQALLSQQLVQVNEAIHTLVHASAPLQTNVTLLQSIPGIGPLTAALLLVETMHLGQMENSNQWAAYAGLSPVPRQSGNFTGRTHISKIGNARLRRAFYLCALTASRMKNALGDFYRHLTGQGKPKKVALIALARKLLRVAFTVLKSGQKFNPDYRRPSPMAA